MVSAVINHNPHSKSSVVIVSWLSFSASEERKWRKTLITVDRQIWNVSRKYWEGPEVLVKSAPL